MSGEQLRIRVQHRDRICVVALYGPLDITASAELAECIKAGRTAQPARIVVDMSGASIVDSGGARALAAVARPVPGQCPVVVRSLRPADRRLLELTGLDLGRPDHEARSPDPDRHGWNTFSPDSTITTLVRECQIQRATAERIRVESYRTAQALASTETQVAATLLRIAARRPPAAAARLETLSRTARDYAAILQERRREAPAPRRRLRNPSGTAALAAAFIEERARDDIGVADIAAAAFVTVRAVQLAFRHDLGTTPMAYLRQVRLERAHEELLAADPGRTTVTAVAADWHFTNASRFSAYYRAVYGIPPAQTLHQRHAGG